MHALLKTGGRRLAVMLDWATRRLAEASLFCMMGLTMVDVVGRYLFNLPVAGSVELTELLMVAVIFCGIALASTAQGHVTVDLFALALKGTVRRMQRLLGRAVSLGIIALLAVVSWGKAAEIADYGDLTAVFLLPIAPAAYLMAVMLSLTSLTHLVQFIELVCRWPDEADPP